MHNLTEYLKNEFTIAPLWQKVLLLSLLSILIFICTLLPLFQFSAQRILALNSQRDEAYSQLHSAQILMQDEKIIIKNYNALKESLSPELSTKNKIQALVKTALDKHAVRVYELDWGQQWQKDYRGLAIAEVNIKTRVTEKEIQPLLDELLAPAYSRADALQYLDSVLTAKIHYLVQY